uniref:Peroxisome proliferator-activated receptor gamma coactivator-related protein 1-like isoform X1 n=1 Tax=Petromyzon marinus TaxID=7757 RepID=A0AAJ7SZE6_PETMA|nr:peroxisome proliferator-activated receptor gamma coactivator-related protein 1-like isoform X1 [Petromyzon marinus]XP_032808300.1 peroxisome proliferator-activated receptor gamma coactivator-related protein 1-like isoform X1 [Petromyzon marinus]XP_032808301.1 peroxisome proliferator-activated receptor gamma coactivator-related protein 1-like isoform X1 [Petromyzon marinus]
MEVGALPGLASPLSAFSCGREGAASECGTMLASESLLSPELDSLSPLDGLLCSSTSDTSDAPWLQGGGSGGGGGDGSIGDATLLMALAETLDSLDDNTASPFDGLLDPEPRLLACDVEESSTLKRLLLSPVSGAESRVASTRHPYSSVTTRLPTSPGRHANRPRQRHPTPTYLELLRHLCTLESAAYSPVGGGGSAVCDWEGSSSGSSGEDMPEKQDGSAESFCASGGSGASSSSSNDEDDIGMLLPEGDVEELQKLMAMDGSFEFDVIDLKEGSVVELVSYMHTYCVRDSVASLSLLSPVKAPCGPSGGASPDGGSSASFARALAGSSADVSGSEGGEEQARGTDGDGCGGGTAAHGTGFLGPLDGLCESSSLDCGSEKASLGRDAKERAERSAGAIAATVTTAPAAVTPGPEEISAATFPAAKTEREDEADVKAEKGDAVPLVVPQKRPRGRPRTRNVNGQQEPGAAAAAAMTKKAVRSILFEEPPRRSVRISKARKETTQSDAAQQSQARPPPEHVAHPVLARVDFNRTTAEVETKPIVVVQQQQSKLSKVIGGLAASPSSTSPMTRPAPFSLSAPSVLGSVSAPSPLPASAPSPLPASASSVSISSPAPSSSIVKPTTSALVTPPTVMTLSSLVPPPPLTTLSSMPSSPSPSSSLTPPSSVLPSSTAPSSRTPPLSTLSVAPSPSVPSDALSAVPPSLSAPPSTSMTPPLSHRPASSAPPPDGEAPPPPLPAIAVPPDANAEEESGAKRRRISLLQYRRRMEERGLELGPHAAGGAGVQWGLAEQSGADNAASADAPAEAAAESMEDDNYLETDPTIRAFFEEIGIEASDLGSLLQQFEESEGKRREVPESTATRTVGTLGQAHVQDVGMELELTASEVRETPGVIAPSTSLHPKPDAKVNLASRGTSAKRKAPRSPQKRGIPLAGKIPRLEAATKQPCSGQLAPSTPAAAQAASSRFAQAAATIPAAGARMIPPLPAGVGAAAQDPPCVGAPNAVGPVKLPKVEQPPTLPPAWAGLGVASPSVVADKTLSLPASQPVANRTPPCQSNALPNPVRVAIPAAATAKMLPSMKFSLVPAVAGKPPAAANPSCAAAAAVITTAVQLDIFSRVSASNLASPLVASQVVNGCSANKSEIGATPANGAVVEREAEIQIPNVRDHDYCQQSTAGNAAATVSESAGAPANAEPRRDEGQKLKRQYRTRAPGGEEADRGSSPPAQESSCCSTNGSGGGGSSSSSGGDSEDDEPGYYDKLPGYYRSGKSLPEPKYQPLRAERAAAGLAEGRERGSRRSTSTSDEYSSASDEERSPGKAARHRRYYSKLPVYLSAASKVSNLPYADCGQETANSDTDTSGDAEDGSRRRRTRSRGSQDRRCGERRHGAATSGAGGGSLSSSPGRRDSVSPPSAAAASPHQRGRRRSRSRSGYGRRYRAGGGGRSSSSTTSSSHRRSVSPVPSFSSDVPRSRRPSPRYDAYERRSERPWLERRESNILEQRRRLHQKAIEERRVIYVGKINNGMTTLELRRRFQSFGEIENCSVHFRERGDNYGFVTYRFTCDAFAALEKGHLVHLPNEMPFDLCFGGRRQFCKASYADLDSNRGLERSTDRRTAMASLDFDSLLKAAKHGM